MTNQEAIKVLNCTSLQTFCLCKVAIDGKMLSMKEALGMGIKALENQKTGHWVEIDDYPHEDFECDCCGGKVYGTEEPYEEYKYCPNCGAKMAESEDKE